MVDLWGPGAFGAADAVWSRPAYTPSNGALDPDSFYKDCSSPAEDDGTEWKSAALNMMLAQMRQVVRRSSVPASNLDDDLLLKALVSGAATYAVATGTANAWTVAPSLAVPAYAAGRVLWIKAPATNTSTTVTMNVSTLGNRRIKKADGTDPAIGDLVSGVWYPTIDDGSNICVVKNLASDIVAGINASGTAPQLNFFELKTARTQSVPASTTTVINDFAVTQSKASDAVFAAGGQITIGAKTAGVWSFNQYYSPGQTGGAATSVQAYLFKNGVNVQNQTVTGTFCSNSGTVRVAAGDILSMAVWHNASGARPNFWASAAPPDTSMNLYQISS